MRGLLPILLAILSIQGGAALAKSLFPALGPYTVSAGRLVVAALVLMAFRRPWRRRVDKKHLYIIIVYGLFLGVMNLLFYLSLARIPLGIAVAIEFLGPLTVGIFAARTRWNYLWAGLAMLGLVLLAPNRLSVELDGIGVLFALGAGACWGGYIIFGRRVGAVVEAGVATSLGMVVAAAVVLPLSLLSLTFTEYAGLSIQHLPLLIAIGILSSALPYSLEMVALKAMPAATFGILMSLEPAVASVVGWLSLGEYLSVLQWFAVFTIVMASAGSIVTSQPAERA